MPAKPEQTGTLPPDMRDVAKTARRGLWIIAIGLGGFILWASLAPLAQGVAGSGTVVVAGERKTVQALTGGAVERIMVREGDHVQAEQLLMADGAFRYLIQKLESALLQHADKLEPLDAKLIRLITDNPAITLGELMQLTQCTVTEARLARFQADSW